MALYKNMTLRLTLEEIQAFKGLCLEVGESQRKVFIRAMALLGLSLLASKIKGGV